MTISQLQIVKMVLYSLIHLLGTSHQLMRDLLDPAIALSSFFKEVNKEVLIFFILIPDFPTQYLTIQDPYSCWFGIINTTSQIGCGGPYLIILGSWTLRYHKYQASKVLFSSIVNSRVCLVLCGPFCKERETESDGKLLLLNDL